MITGTQACFSRYPRKITRKRRRLTKTPSSWITTLSTPNLTFWSVFTTRITSMKPLLSSLVSSYPLIPKPESGSTLMKSKLWKVKGMNTNVIGRFWLISTRDISIRQSSYRWKPPKTATLKPNSKLKRSQLSITWKLMKKLPRITVMPLSIRSLWSLTGQTTQANAFLQS